MDAVILSSPDNIIDSRGDISQIYPYASITKLFAAYATLIAHERGLVDYEEEEGGITIRHLLGHASGLPFGEGASLAEPGHRRIYSNRGFNVLGERMSEALGRPFTEWIDEEVLMPLGLTSVLIEGSPADSGEGNAEDLATFGRELLNPTLVSEETLEEATHVSFGQLPGVLPGFGRQANNAWGLGFEIKAEKSPHWLSDSFPASTFGHFGQSGSFLFVDREEGLVGGYVGDRPFGKWHAKMWPILTESMHEGKIASEGEVEAEMERLESKDRD